MTSRIPLLHEVFRKIKGSANGVVEINPRGLADNYFSLGELMAASTRFTSC